MSSMTRIGMGSNAMEGMQATDQYTRVAMQREVALGIESPGAEGPMAEAERLFALFGEGSVDSERVRRGNDEMFTQQPLGVVTQTVTVTAANMDSEVKAACSVLERAPIKLLAPTGCGKTTRLPLIARDAVAPGKVLVVEPTVLLVESAASYLANSGHQVAVDTGEGPVPSETLVFMTGVALLRRLLVGAFYLVGVALIILDEAHDASAAYYALRAFLYAKAGGIRIFHCSATFGEEASEHNRSGFKMGIHRMPKVGLGDLPSSISNHAVLNPTAIRGRTLLFVGSELQAGDVEAFYKRAGLYVLRVRETEGVGGLLRAKIQLDRWKGYNAVVIATSGFEYGLTLPVDNVIDLGFKVTVIINLRERSMLEGVRMVTSAEQTQRAGRVGRVSNGAVYQNPVELSPCLEVEKPQRFYAYVWLRALGLEPLEEFRVIGEVMEPLKRFAAQQLLTIRLHPLLTRRFMDDEGFFFANYSEALRPFFSNGSPEFSRKVLVPTVADGWFEHTYADVVTGRLLKVCVPLQPDGSCYRSVMEYIAVVSAKYSSPDVAEFEGEHMVTPIGHVARYSRAAEPPDYTELTPSPVASPVLRGVVSAVLSPDSPGRAGSSSHRRGDTWSDDGTSGGSSVGSSSHGLPLTLRAGSGERLVASARSAGLPPLRSLDHLDPGVFLTPADGTIVNLTTPGPGEKRDVQRFIEGRRELHLMSVETVGRYHLLFVRYWNYKQAQYFSAMAASAGYLNNAAMSLRVRYDLRRWWEYRMSLVKVRSIHHRMNQMRAIYPGLLAVGYGVVATGTIMHNGVAPQSSPFYGCVHAAETLGRTVSESWKERMKERYESVLVPVYTRTGEVAGTVIRAQGVALCLSHLRGFTKDGGFRNFLMDVVPKAGERLYGKGLGIMKRSRRFRMPIQGELVAYAWVDGDLNLQFSAAYEVFVGLSGHVGFTFAGLLPGSSGAVLLALRDGKIVGLHYGKAQYVQAACFVPTHFD